MTTCTKLITYTKRPGYYTVEAAIFLPVFLVAALCLGYVVKVIGAAEDGMHAAVDESRRQAAYAYVDRAGVGFSDRIKNRIIKDNKFITNAKVHRMRYLSRDGVISFNMDYHIDVHLPLDMYDGFDVRDRLKCRGWIGKSYNDPFGFDAMERDEDATLVYIFPMWGSRYHKKSCTYVTAHPVQTALSNDVKKRYDACAGCKPGSLANGSIVYVFPKYGGSYHRGSCSSVKKYTITIELTQAKKRGYSACSKCGGT